MYRVHVYHIEIRAINEHMIASGIMTWFESRDSLSSSKL